MCFGTWAQGCHGFRHTGVECVLSTKNVFSFNRCVLSLFLGVSLSCVSVSVSLYVCLQVYGMVCAYRGVWIKKKGRNAYVHIEVRDPNDFNSMIKP